MDSVSSSTSSFSQNGTPISYLRPLMFSMFGVVLTGIAIVCYHVLLVKYCKRRSIMEARAAMQTSTSRLGISGVDKKVLERIPIVKFSAVGRETDQEEECVVCLGEVESEELVRVLPNCKHAFHVMCVDQWLAEHVSCPLCRSLVTVEADSDSKPSPRNGNGGEQSEFDETRAGEVAFEVILPTERSRAAPLRLKRSLSIDQSMFVDLECGGYPSSSLRDTLTRSESLSLSVSGMDRLPTKWISSFSQWRVVKGRTRRILPY